MLATIYHNPKCSTSRRTLKLIENKGPKPLVIDYMAKPPSAAEIKGLLRLLGVSAHDVLRDKEKEYAALGLSPDTPEDDILNAIHANPRLLQRPIVMTAKGARIARPPEKVLEIL